jgi:hypothetical protein
MQWNAFPLLVAAVVTVAAFAFGTDYVEHEALVLAHFGGHGLPPLCCHPVWHSGQLALRFDNVNGPPRASLTMCAACIVSHEIQDQHFGLSSNSQRPAARSNNCSRISVVCLRSAADLLCRRIG